MVVKEPLMEWIRENAWDPIEINTDPLVEARDNLYRLLLTFEEVGQLAASDCCEFVETYVSIKRQQLIDDHSKHSMLVYVWFDEMAGSLCISSISNNAGWVMPFSCQIDTNASLETVVNSFMQSHYLEGIPNAELSTFAKNRWGTIDGKIY